MSTTVRRATTGDVPWLLEQLRAFDRFFGARHSLFPDEHYARAMLTNSVDGLRTVACLAHHRDGRVRSQHATQTTARRRLVVDDQRAYVWKGSTTSHTTPLSTFFRERRA